MVKNNGYNEINFDFFDSKNRNNIYIEYRFMYDVIEIKLYYYEVIIYLVIKFKNTKDIIWLLIEQIDKELNRFNSLNLNTLHSIGEIDIIYNNRWLYGINNDILNALEFFKINKDYISEELQREFVK
jgi:hypothetical protein